MRFEKWQALGNDYLIVEAPAVAPERVKALCDRHLGVGADGVLALAPADGKRLVRTLELLDAGEAPPGGGRLWTRDTRHPTLLAGLVMDRDALRRRVDARVDAMVAAGAVDEVRRADATGASPSARQALGFEELLRGDVEAMRIRTRRYAKRQLTWLRKLPGAHLIDVTGRSPDDVAAELIAII